MGVKCSPDFTQETMETVLCGNKELECFLDNIGIFGCDWQHHLASLSMILQQLQDNGFTVNPLKCEWSVQETDWLSHWLTPTGVPLLNLVVPTRTTQVRSFIGAVTFYRDFWRRRSHILAPLTAIVGKTNQKKPFEWTNACDRAFKEAKALLAADVLLRYLDPNLPYHIIGWHVGSRAACHATSAARISGSIPRLKVH
jgi:hypothetical protein